MTTLSDQALLINGDPIKGSTNIKTRDILQVGKFTLIYFGDNLTPMDQFFEGKGFDEFHPTLVQPMQQSPMPLSQCLPQMRKKLLHSNNLARNARLKTSDGSQIDTAKMA